MLITGGTGTLARVVARHLVTRRGVRHLILAGRRGTAAEGAAELAADLAALGAEVTIAACDVADRDQLARLLAGVPAEHPLTAVLHAAGVADYGVLDEAVTDERIDGVLRPKVDGAWHLHELTRDRNLAAFVLFSSVAGAVGAVGHAAQGAASTFLDALAQHRRSTGRPATALAFGPCGDPAGTASRGGLAALPVPAALAAVDSALDGTAQPLLVPARWDLPALRGWQSSGLLPAVLRGLTDAAPVTAAAEADRTGPDPAGPCLAELPAAERPGALLRLVCERAAAVLGHTGAGELDPARTFLEQGFDSLTGVELRNHLTVATGLTLAPTLIFDHPDPAGLAGHLNERLGDPAGPPADRPAAAPAGDDAHSLPALYRRAAENGQADLANDLLALASRLRPTIVAGDLDRHVPEPVRLAAGPDGPAMICFPATAPTAGPQQYARFAAAFRGRRGVLALANPGYAADGPVPASFDVLVDLHAEAVRRAADGPVVLVGHSAGGLIAHAVGTRLRELGRPPVAVVLVDTGWVGGLSGDTGAALLAEVLKRERQLGGQLIDGVRLTAMGAYNRIMADWTPERSDLPTLLVRAGDALAGTAVFPRAVWRLPHAGVEVPGDHFTMMEAHAATTAGAVADWLATLVPAVSSGGRS